MTSKEYEKNMKLICKWCNVNLQEDEKIYCTDCRRLKEWRINEFKRE